MGTNREVVNKVTWKKKFGRARERGKTSVQQKKVKKPQGRFPCKNVSWVTRERTRGRDRGEGGGRRVSGWGIVI